LRAPQARHLDAEKANGTLQLFSKKMVKMVEAYKELMNVHLQSEHALWVPPELAKQGVRPGVDQVRANIWLPRRLATQRT
jgi:hypothetical protein